MFFRLSEVRSKGAAAEAGKPKPTSRHLLHLIQRNIKAFPGQPRDVISPACPGSPPGPSPDRTWLAEAPYPQGDRLSWLLSIWRSSTLSSSQLARLITLSLRENPSICWRKFMSTASVRDLIEIVSTKRSGLDSEIYGVSQQ